MGPARAIALLLLSICLCAVGRAGLAQEDEPEWGEAKDGLRTRLSTEKSTYPVDEPIRLTLELKSEKPEDWEYFPPQTLPREEGLIVRREGRPVRYISGPFQTGAGFTKLAAGATAVLGTVVLNKHWDVREPGHYTVQFPETVEGHTVPDPFANDETPLRLVFPASNVVQFEIIGLPGSKVPPRDISRRVKVLFAQGHGAGSRWRGLAFNYRPRELPETAEAVGALFGVEWGDNLRAYEDWIIALALRLPNFGTGDELDVERAEIDGSTIRISIQHHPAADGGPGGRPFLFIPLERLLGPGQYACEVRLATHRPEASGAPRTDGYELRFEVLPRETEAVGAP